MVDFSVDEKIGGAALIFAGITGLLYYGTASISEPYALILSAIVLGSGVYTVLQLPYNNVPLFVAPVLALFVGFITLSWGSSPIDSAIIPWSLMNIGSYTGFFIGGLAGWADIIEEYI